MILINRPRMPTDQVAFDHHPREGDSAKENPTDLVGVEGHLRARSAERVRSSVRHVRMEEPNHRLSAVIYYDPPADWDRPRVPCPDEMRGSPATHRGYARLKGAKGAGKLEFSF